MITGYEMDMDVRDSLSCCLMHVDANIKAIRTELLCHHLLDFVQQLHTMALFLWRKIKITGSMPIGDDKCMTRADGKFIKIGLCFSNGINAHDLHLEEVIKIYVKGRNPIPLRTVERFVGRDQVPDQVVRHKRVWNEMLNGIIILVQWLTGINTMLRTVLINNNIPEFFSLFGKAVSSGRLNQLIRDVRDVWIFSL